MQRAECVPITTDRNYLHLKRETMKNHIEPKRQIKMADGFVQRHHFLPKSSHIQNVRTAETRIEAFLLSFNFARHFRMKKKTKPRKSAKTRISFWIYYSMHLQSISTTILRILRRSLNSLQ